jgi:hypothetical protein
MTIDDTDVVRAAREALTRPDDFGYYGPLDMFRSWGFTVARHRDSDALDESNFRCLARDLRAEVERRGDDPDEYVSEVSCGHWAHGWMEHLAVRVLVDPDGEVTADNVTHAFRWIADAAVYLREQYPVWDDEDHSELEYEGHDETWTNCTWPDFKSGNWEDDRAYENDQPGRDFEYLDAIDAPELQAEVANYAPEYDPNTWDDSDIWAGIVRLAEREAYGE